MSILSLEPVPRALLWLNELGKRDGVVICSPSADGLKKQIEATLRFNSVDCVIIADPDDVTSHLRNFPSYKIVILEGEGLQCIQSVRSCDPRTRIIVLSEGLCSKEKSVVHHVMSPQNWVDIGATVRRQIGAIGKTRRMTVSLVSTALVGQIAHNAQGIVASLPQNLQNRFENLLTYISVELTSLWHLDRKRGVLKGPQDKTTRLLDGGWREDLERTVCSALDLESGSVIIMLKNNWLLILPVGETTRGEIAKEGVSMFVLNYSLFADLFYFVFVT